MPYSVRPANLSDLAALAALEAEGFGSPWEISLLAGHLSSPGSVTLIAEEEGRAVGALCGRCLPPEGELYRIVTRPDSRRRGIGKRLLSAFLACLDAAGAPTCFLEVRAGNAPAIALYTAAGFFTVGRRKNYYKNPCEDALVLRRG